jgi:Metallo-beta-lactamase superfamily
MTKRAARTRKANPHDTVGISTTFSSSNQGIPVRRRSRNAFRAKIRMYRQGLGDCFLVALPRFDDQDNYHILIDCGVILGTPDAGTTMTKVLEDVSAVSKGRIDLLIATHQHWDHLSGFIQAAETFDALDVRKVWLAWTESPDDELAKELVGEREAAAEALRLAGSCMLISGDLEGADELAGFASFFGIAGGVSTQDAIEKVRKKASIRYCYPTDKPVHLSEPDVLLYVLGPPHDAKLVRQTLDTKRDPQTYGIRAQMLGADVMSAMNLNEQLSPFSTLHAIPMRVAGSMDFFRQHYFGAIGNVDNWRRIDSGWLDASSELALALDSATNNTSLVLAIELRDGDVLLFVADAQVGSWLSWQDLKWMVGSREVTGPDLLRRTVFYKVGHHGSHNATLREKGLEQMERLAIAAIPVDHDMAVKKRWVRMPLPELVAALREKASKGVLRCDQNPEQPMAGVLADKLFFEITF